MTAKEMKQIAIDVSKFEVAAVIDMIRQGAQKGMFSYTVYKLSDACIDFLIKSGYGIEIQEINGIQTGIKVTWDKI